MRQQQRLENCHPVCYNNYNKRIPPLDCCRIAGKTKFLAAGLRNTWTAARKFGSFHLGGKGVPAAADVLCGRRAARLVQSCNPFEKRHDRKENAVMKTVEYTITDELGIHARPAGLLVKEAAKFASSIKIAGPKKEVDAKRIMGVMSLGVKQGDTVCLTIEGEDEAAAAAALEQFLKDNL